jgi:predicted metalloenzyme YecM
MPGHIREIIGDYVGFIQNVDEGLQDVGIERDEISMIDHICYRVETEERYHEMLERCAQIGTLLGVSDINGRPIATFEFNEYLSAAGWTVPYLELPAPKEG